MKNKILIALSLISFLLFTSWMTVRMVEGYQFNKNVSGHLKRAANANTVEMASSELKLSIDYLKENDLTSGSTYIIFDTPSKDVGYWYQNLESASSELNKVNDKTAQLEKSNLLLKLRETLTDQNSDGETEVIAPDGISIYPNNLLFAIWGWISFAFCAICGVILAWKWFDY